MNGKLTFLFLRKSTLLITVCGVCTSGELDFGAKLIGFTSLNCGYKKEGEI